MPTQEPSLKLHDIKELAVVTDYSVYYFYALIAFGVLVFLLLAYILYRYLKRQKALDEQTQLLNTLKAIDYSDAKHAAYTLTLCGNALQKDLPQTKAYENLLPKLQAFKYKKHVGSFSDALQQEAKDFIDMMES